MIHPFHVLRLRIWPVVLSYVVIRRFINFFLFIKFGGYGILVVNFVFLFLLGLWFKDVARESEIEMAHSRAVDKFLSLGMILFIRSEVMFFVSFFWCYFDCVLVVDSEIGRVWPPLGVSRINPFRVPLLNTLILLSSGVTITWCHFRILNNFWFSRVVSIIVTLVLGVYFLYVQYCEYNEASFTFVRRNYGRIFFLATGFHGFHVLLGCFIILVRAVRLLALSIEAWVHYGFEFSAWYWHFVDVVWLFLFVFIYWWGY